ncbi:MAG: class I adenylate-forming enzyme family protein [bacterium]|nr:class I adenylate-forming enzyme family protein [bacterium]
MKNLRINNEFFQNNSNSLKIDRDTSKKITGYASIDRPWLQYYDVTPESVEIPNQKLYQFIYENNKAHLDDVAINYYHKKITYRELFSNVEKLTANYLKLGIKPGDVVPICSLTTPEMLYSFFALNNIGAIANMLDPRTGIEGLKKHINENNSKFLITLDVFSSKLNEFINDTTLENIISFSLGDSLPKIKEFLLSMKMKKQIKPFNFKGNVINSDEVLKKAVLKDNLTNKQNDVACIVYTGGTTGEPKSVMLSNKNFVAMAIQYSKLKLNMKRGDTFLSIIPPFFPYGICVSTYVPIALGLETIIVPKFDASIFPELMMEYKPNHVTGVPKYWEALMKGHTNKKTDLSFIKSAGCGGDGMNAELETQINNFLKAHKSTSKVMKGYGMTEVSAAAVTCTDNCNEIGSVGIPLICNNVSIFDKDTDRELSYLSDEKGEICISGPCTMYGYKDNELATNELIRTHSDGEKWVHTGDCGRMDENGNLFVEGRYKRVIVRRGMNIYPLAIENIIMQSKFIDSVAVIGMEHPDLVSVPVACYTVKEEYKQDLDRVIADIQNLCCRELPDYSLPYNYMMIDSMPFTSAGKIDFRSLEDMVNQKESPVKKLILQKE